MTRDAGRPAIPDAAARVLLPHHQKAVDHWLDRLSADPEVEALLLAGSVAHGFARPQSDLDLLIVVPDAVHEVRLREGRLQLASAEGCEWEGGYVDGKYVSPAFLERVARAGSEPARFAFRDARVLFSRIPDLEGTLARIPRYPVEGKAERIRRFLAQFEAWHWYGHEALKLGDRYLLGTAVARSVLFGGRMILAHNELLYPFHKWFLRVLEAAADRPPDLMERIAALHAEPSQATLLGLWASVRNFRAWEGADRPWPAQFMLDSELGWLDGRTPLEDL
jgi:predicted nucleotidyltransferase